MLKIIEKIWKAGVKEDHDEDLRKKIIITNQILLSLISCVGIPFLFITKIFYGEHTFLTFIPAFGMVMSAVIYGINIIGLHVLGRLLVSILSVGVVAAYHAGLVNSGDQPIPTSFLLQLSLSLIPFIIFSLKEWRVLVITGVFNISAFVLFDYYNEWVELGADDSLFRYQPLATVNAITAVVLAYVIIYVLVNSNRKSQDKNKKLVQEMDVQKLELEASEIRLKDNIEKLKEAQEEEQKRNWTNEGLAKFSDILRNNDGDIQELSFQVISNLVRYMEFNQGGIFVLEEDKDEGTNYLELKSCYAYDRKKFMEKRIEEGNGLLGQSILEKETILLKEVPENYINITSGIGQATANTLLIVPLIINNTVFGALELASFGDVEEYKVDFVEKLSESVASTISAARVNENTKGLLEESQMLAEQMKAQEEEMRQNMEELQATQEEMERKSKEIENRLQTEKEKYEQQIQEQQMEIEAIQKSKAILETEIERLKKQK